MSLQATPNSNRLHIGIFGRRNVGKSSLINALTNQNTSLVSDFSGTTTDPVYKAMEVRGIGPCVFIDTAGFDDDGELGALRVEQTKKALQKTDIALLVFSSQANSDLSLEEEWLYRLNELKIPVLPIITQMDKPLSVIELPKKVKELCKSPALEVSSTEKIGIEAVLSSLVRLVPADYDTQSITGHLVKPLDVVMLVMPQDSEAPKGRLILPQVQTTRDLLDNRCIIVSCTPETMEKSLSSLSSPPDLIITDSQVFAAVYEKTPKESKLTSFSVLMAGAKGDLPSYISGAKAIAALTSSSRILIAEACTHAPLSEDIGRVKIPAMLKRKYGDGISITIVSGADFPADLSGYDLIVHCGGCMFNKKYMLSRIACANEAGIPITNYGILLAHLNGILDKIVY